MKRICAWCGKYLGEKPGLDRVVTHGICDECAKEMNANLNQGLQSFLDRLEAPVLMVDHDGVVLTANLAACEKVDKELYEVRDFRGGDVMECARARLPGGCGQTEHCQACTIRNSVMETHATGKGIDKREAYQLIFTPQGEKKMRLLISTEKINQVVLLRIDEMGEA
jgi:hypothetical protein